METTYFVCHNSHCEKHRNIFAEGDPLHQNCERERLHFAGERRMPVWAWAAVPLALAALALAVQAIRSNARRSVEPERETHRPVARESERHAAPPPISRASS